jgi:hypothetical protein
VDLEEPEKAQIIHLTVGHDWAALARATTLSGRGQPLKKKMKRIKRINRKRRRR